MGFLATYVVSSAKSTVPALVELGKSFIYSKKNSEPRIEPYGTPNLTDKGENMLLSKIIVRLSNTAE